MSNEKWTPGPWSVADNHVPPIIYSTVTEDCVALQDSDGAYADCWFKENYGRHNSRLIAAAPDLYEALKSTNYELRAAIDEVNRLKSSAIRGDDIEPPDYWDQQTCVENYSLMAKARGDS